MIFRRARGMYFSARDQGDLHAIIQVKARPSTRAIFLGVDGL
jgi:hypothetical protein